MSYLMRKDKLICKLLEIQHKSQGERMGKLAHLVRHLASRLKEQPAALSAKDEDAESREV